LELTIVATLAKNLKLGIDATLNRGEYRNERSNWEETEFAEISRYISRFPARTGNIKLEYTPKSWVFSITGNYQGALYIDYNSEEDPSAIIKTEPYILFNARASKDLGNLRIYAGVNNIFNYVQNIRYLDDPAFIYAPLYGSIFYAGASITIRH
jgi:outer membrane receptor for ferrienterochelin and colicins